MDFAILIISVVLTSALLMFASVVFSLWLKKYKRKVKRMNEFRPDGGSARLVTPTGNSGRFAATVEKRLTALPKGMKMVKNLYFTSHDGNRMRKIRVPVLLINETGFYILESQDATGKITGGAKDDTWTAQNSRGRVIKEFDNPRGKAQIRANTLCAEADIPREYVHTFIVFDEGTDFKDAETFDESFTLCCADTLQRELSEIISQSPSILENAVIQKKYYALLKYVHGEE